MYNFYSDIFSHFVASGLLSLSWHIIFTDSGKTLSCLVYLLFCFFCIFIFLLLYMLHRPVKHPVFNIFPMGTQKTQTILCAGTELEAMGLCCMVWLLLLFSVGTMSLRSVHKYSSSHWFLNDTEATYKYLMTTRTLCKHFILYYRHNFFSLISKDLTGRSGATDYLQVVPHNSIRYRWGPRNIWQNLIL